MIHTKSSSASRQERDQDISDVLLQVIWWQKKQKENKRFKIVYNIYIPVEQTTSA